VIQCLSAVFGWLRAERTTAAGPNGASESSPDQRDRWQLLSVIAHELIGTKVVDEGARRLCGRVSGDSDEVGGRCCRGDNEP
jgi:hypothetical protein